MLLNSKAKWFSCQTKRNPHTSSLSPGSRVLVISLCTRTAVRFACNWKYPPIRCTHWGAEQGHIMRHSTSLTSDKQINKCGHNSNGRLVTTRLLTWRPILYLFSTSCGAHQACYSTGIWGPGSGTEYSSSLELRLRMSGAMPLPPHTFMGYTQDNFMYAEGNMCDTFTLICLIISKIYWRVEMVY
jgi:hypothetical protein